MTPRQDSSNALLSRLEALDQRIGTLARTLETLRRVDTLMTYTFRWGAAGMRTFDFAVPYQSVSVYNLDFDSFIYLSSSPPSSDALPIEGPGLVTVSPGRGLVVNLSGYSLTLWGGTPGDVCTVQAFSHPQPPTGWS